jgi:hypothetical protein
VNGSQLAAPVAFNYYPKDLGEPDETTINSSTVMFPQGIRVCEDKLYVIFPDFGYGYPFSPDPKTGLYEFDIPQGLTDGPRTPSRYWHIPQAELHHLEGFDFVPGETGEIFLAYSGEPTAGENAIDRLRLEALHCELNRSEDVESPAT